MPSKFRVRNIFKKKIVKVVSKGLIKIGITPNLATIIMLCFSILSFVSIWPIKNLLLFSIFVFITTLLDGCDGTIARMTNRSSSFGGFFDSVMDRISEFFIFLGLLLFNWNRLLWNFLDVKLIVYISFLASLMISYSRTRAECFFSGDFDVGLMGRSERLFYIFITIIFAHFYGYVDIFLFVFMLSLIATVIFRIIKIYNQIKSQANNIER
ncbi:MAG TPA: CDP-alcohol phosphatidyltransferase family protein [archaeon]|nr:CDP-alcohol phosphatidyltransferase family protein [archaeon]